MRKISGIFEIDFESQIMALFATSLYTNSQNSIIPLGMLIFRKKSFQFCTPRLKTWQPVLPYYSSSLLDQLNWSNEGLSIYIPLVVDNLPDRNSKNLVSNDTVIVWVAYLVLNGCTAFKLPFGRAQIVSVYLSTAS